MEHEALLIRYFPVEVQELLRVTFHLFILYNPATGDPALNVASAAMPTMAVSETTSTLYRLS